MAEPLRLTVNPQDNMTPGPAWTVQSQEPIPAVVEQQSPWAVQSQVPVAAAPTAPQGPTDNPQGTVPAEAAAPSGGWLAKAIEPITSYPGVYNEMRHESQDQFVQGAKDIVPQALGGPEGKTASALWDMAVGGLGTLDSPIRAGLRTVVGKPLEENTGLPKEYTEFAAGLALPYYGLKNTAAAQTFKKIIAPEQMGPDAENAASAIRAEHGTAARTTASSLEEIEKFHPLINNLDEPSRMNLFNHMEGVPGAAPLSPEVQRVADTLKQGFEARKAELQGISRTASARFVADYFPHMWKDPAAAQAFVARYGGKEGSGRNLKARTIPTIEEGLQQGLQLKTSNPLEAYTAYVSNMDRFIATEKVFESAKAAGDVKYFPIGKQPGSNSGQPWVALNGRLDTNAAGQQAYAPEGWARVYNNFTSRGFHDIGAEYGSAFETGRRASNTITALELGLSGYHMVTMTQEAMVNELARAIQQGGRMDPLKAARSLAGTPFAPIVLPLKGHNAEKIYLGTRAGTAEQRELVDILTEAGARMKGARHAVDYKFSGAGSLATAFRRGALGSELRADVGTAISQPLKAPGIVLKNVGRIMDTVMQPIFEKYIPKLKNGAMMENLSDWMKAHPTATRQETVAAARKIVDSVDNRFGEMVHDNVFWNQYLKQVAMLDLRSYSWTMGAIREIGGGAKDVLDHGLPAIAGKDSSQRAAYAIALPIIYGLWGATYQKLKTGENPQDMQDLMAPRTGGVDQKTGQPERITPPGFMKDVFGWATHPRQEMAAKQSTGARLIWEMAVKGKDWRDDPIAPPGDPDLNAAANAPTWLKAYFEHVMQSLGPITVKNMAKGERTGSNLNMFEKIIGIQPAGMEKTDPERFNKVMRSMEERAWKGKLRHDKTEKERYGSGVKTTFGASE